MARSGEISENDYQSLAEFRYHIRRFLRFSERAAREAGVEPQQHQLMLVVKGMPDDSPATIGEIAERLQIQHHSTVELVDRLVTRGFATRKRDTRDRRQVIVQLTAKGDKVLRDLSMHHRDELKEEGAELVTSLRKLMSSLGKPGRAVKKAGTARRG